MLSRAEGADRADSGDGEDVVWVWEGCVERAAGWSWSWEVLTLLVVVVVVVVVLLLLQKRVSVSSCRSIVWFGSSVSWCDRASRRQQDAQRKES